MNTTETIQIREWNEWNLPMILDLIGVFLITMMNIYQTKKLYGNTEFKLDLCGKELIHTEKSVSPLNSEDDMKLPQSQNLDIV